MVQEDKKNSKQTRPNFWTWVSIGVGTGLLVTIVAGLTYQYFESQQPSHDPRADRVKELIEEAERLLIQGRKATAMKKREAEST
jgi:hypothetical protein